jgi:TetR/AcrR family transcriptional repressor of nem operon
MFADTVHHQRLADLEATHGPREAIRQSLSAFVPQGTDKRASRGCFLTNTALELAAHDIEAGRVVAQAQKQTEAWYARMIKKGKALGEIAPHVKPAEAASTLLACLIGVSVLSRSRPERTLLHAIVDDAMRRLS